MTDLPIRPTRPAGPVERLSGQEFEDYLSGFYLTMLRLPRATRGALVEEGYPDDDVTRCCRALEARELIDRIAAQEWEVRPPETALRRFAASMESRARITRAAAAELGVLWRQTRQPTGNVHYRGFEMLGSVDAVLTAAAAMQSLATEEISGLFDASPVSLQRLRTDAPEPGSSDASGPTGPSGVSWRLVVDTSLLAKDGVSQALQARSDAGQQVRVTQGVPFSCTVVDRQAALVDITTYDPSGQGSFVVRRPAAVTAIRRTIDAAFGLATPLAPTRVPLPGASGDGGPPLDPRDRRVLALLATGASDQLIARQIDASTRTVERRVRYLMEHLGAATRFQAGVQAARRGWIDPPPG